MIYSAVGFKTVNVLVDLMEMFNVIIICEDALLDEAGNRLCTARTKDLTGSAVIVKSEDNKGSVTTPEQLVMGKIPGVKINSNNGALVGKYH